MILAALSRLLHKLFYMMICAIVVSGIALGLVRFGVWATGQAHVHADLQGPPHVLTWQMDDPGFGGMSALLIAPDGASLVAGSDHGALVEAALTRNTAGDITEIVDPRLTQTQLSTGTPPRDFKMDLEALTRDPQGGWMLAYESQVRIEQLARAGARPRSTHTWEVFAGLFGNNAFEALATLPDGRVIAITEDSAPAASMLWDGNVWTPGPAIPATKGYRITGADVGPDGCLYLIERRYALAGGFTFALRRLSGGPEAWEDTLLYRTPPARLGNGEGLGVWQDTDGLLGLSVITDDGFLPITPTYLIEFRTRPGVGCRFGF